MTTDHLAILARVKTKCSIIVWCFFYLFLFLFLLFFLIPFARLNLIDLSPARNALGLIDFLPVLAIPLSLILMWVSYLKKHYRVARLCWAIPVLFFALTLLMHVILEPM
jgi:hypothetical protein